MAFHPRRPPSRNDTSAKPSRSATRATTEAAAGVHISAQITEKSPLMMTIDSNTAVSGTRTPKYMASPRRARNRVSPSSAARDAADVLVLGLLFPSGISRSRLDGAGSLLTPFDPTTSVRSWITVGFLVKHSPTSFALMFRRWPDRGLPPLLADTCRTRAALACRR